MKSEPTIQQVMDNSIAFEMRLSRLGTKRTVRAQGDEEGMTLDYGGDAQLEVADKKLVHISKVILTCKELRDIRHRDTETRHWVARQSVPSSLFKGGVYLFPVTMFKEVDGYLINARKEREKLVDAFVDAYPTKIKEAKAKLKKLFNAADYPAVSTLGAQFSMTWRIVTIGPDEKLKKLDPVLFERESKKAEKAWTNAAVEIRDAVRASMASMVAAMAESLTAGEDGKAKRFKPAAVKRMSDFLDVFEKRNLTNDVELGKLVLSAKKILTGVDAKSLRKDDKLRTRVAQGFGELKGKLSGMVETKPARKITLADEEEVA